MSVSLRPLVVSILLLALAPVVEAQTAAAPAEDPAALEQQFAERMTGARLIGKFTVVTPQGEQAPQGDEYAISELVRGEGDEWIFRYTMSYGGGQKMTVPIPVRVVWSGDTPVLTMTNQAVEGLGTFSVRLLIYDDLYAGTWSNGPIGGHMWGRIETGTESESAAAPDNGPAER